MHRVLPFAVAEFLQLDLWGSAGDFDLRAVVKIVALRALKPRHFSILFCHDNTLKLSVVSRPLSVAHFSHWNFANRVEIGIELWR